jgi:hypothetical protein
MNHLKKRCLSALQILLSLLTYSQCLSLLSLQVRATASTSTAKATAAAATPPTSKSPGLVPWPRLYASLRKPSKAARTLPTFWRTATTACQRCSSGLTARTFVSRQAAGRSVTLHPSAVTLHPSAVTLHPSAVARHARGTSATTHHASQIALVTLFFQSATDFTAVCHAPVTRADLGKWLHVCAVFDGAAWTMCAARAIALFLVQKVTIFTCTKMPCASLQWRRVRASSEWLAGGHSTRAFDCHNSESSLFNIIIVMS